MRRTSDKDDIEAKLMKRKRRCYIPKYDCHEPHVTVASSTMKNVIKKTHITLKSSRIRVNNLWNET